MCCAAWQPPACSCMPTAGPARGGTSRGKLRASQRHSIPHARRAFHNPSRTSSCYAHMEAECPTAPPCACSFLRLPSTRCEQQQFEELMHDLDADLLMRLALGQT